MIPGSNLLLDALEIIDPSKVTYYKFLSRTVNDRGLFETEYDTAVNLYGSFQPVPRNMYEQYGLELEKIYALFYTKSNVISLARDKTGDKIVFASVQYQCEANNDWYAIDGWKGVLMSAVDT